MSRGSGFGSSCEERRPLRHVRLAADCGSAEEPFYGFGGECDSSPTDRERSVTKLTHPNKPRGVAARSFGAGSGGLAVLAYLIGLSPR
jgi:hypothetical protein